MNKKWFPVSFLLAFVLVLNACGRTGDGASTNLTVELTDFKFTPDTFTVPAGEEITLAVNNKGAVEHEFVIMKLGTEVSSPFNDDDEGNIFWEVELEKGASETLTFTAPSEPGEYQISCGTPGHHEAGMIGKLIVVK
jgi:uncharacterized cupredoxin-like copper-binding protein